MLAGAFPCAWCAIRGHAALFGHRPPNGRLAGPANIAVQPAFFAREIELPRYLTRFTGRERELGELGNLLGQDHQRLVSLIGPGGVGKTRLLVEAIAAAQNQLTSSPFAFVDGAAIPGASELLPELAKQLGLEQLGDETLGGQISEFLADRRALVVLDNMEHLLDASLDLAALLRACPRLRIFCTSRAPLRISSECLMAIDPLQTAAAPAATLSPAAELFVDRALLARPGFRVDEQNRATVEALCVRLDGLPLAIELAAARMRMLSPEALTALLTRQLSVLGGGAVDLAPRHRTLQAAIAWSYELLDEAEQQLFRGLGIFPESFALDMVEAVCCGDGALDRLTALFDHGLLQIAGTDVAGQARFRMLVSIREYARELLEQSGELESTAMRLTESVVAYVAIQVERLIGPQQAIAMEELAAESVTIRAVLERAIERRDIETSLSLIGGLWRFWTNRGLFHDARDIIDRALAGHSYEISMSWGLALRGAAVVAEMQSDWEAARAWGEAALDIWTELGETARMASSWIDFGNVHSTSGSLDDARAAYARAATLAHEAGDRRLEFIATGSLANVALRQGRLVEAAEGYERALPIARQIGDQWMLATLLSNFGIALVRLDRRERALANLRESLVLYRELGDEAGLASALTNLDEAMGDASIGGALAQEALEIATRLDAPYLIGPANLHLGIADLRNRDVQAAGRHLAIALRNFQIADNPIFACEAIELIAELVARTDPTLAARFLGGTAAYRSRGTIEWQGYHAPRAKALDARLRNTLGSDFGRAWQEGRSLDLPSLIIEALAAGYHPAQPAHVPREHLAETPLLTARERMVLRLIVDGKSDREIGAELFISPKTVNRHVTSLLAKLECRNRTAAAAIALQLGLV